MLDNTDKSWPDAVICELRRLYPLKKDNGKPLWPLSEIGKLLSAMPEADRVYGKNHVVGRCHRLKLEPRYKAPNKPNGYPKTRKLKGSPKRRRPVQTEKVIRAKKPKLVQQQPVIPAPQPLMRITWTSPLLLTWTPPAVITWVEPVAGEASTLVLPPWEDVPVESSPPDILQEAAQPLVFSPGEPIPLPVIKKLRRSDGLSPSPLASTNGVVSIRSRVCQFPTGEPGEKNFSFCGKRTWSCTDPSESSTYCEYHYRRCHVVNQDRERHRQDRLDRQSRRA